MPGQEHHRILRSHLEERIVFKKYELDCQVKMRSAEFLLSMISLWVEIPRTKANMNAVEDYVERINAKKELGNKEARDEVRKRSEALRMRRL